MEIVLAQAKRLPSIVQIQKLIVSTDPEDWDGEILGDPVLRRQRNWREKKYNLLLKQRHMGLQGRNP